MSLKGFTAGLDAVDAANDAADAAAAAAAAEPRRQKRPCRQSLTLRSGKIKGRSARAGPFRFRPRGRPGPRSARQRQRRWTAPPEPAPARAVVRHHVQRAVRVGRLESRWSAAGCPSVSARRQAIASSAPVAPMAWPCIALVDDTGGARRPEHRPDRRRFAAVIRQRAGAMRVDVADVGRRHPRIAPAPPASPAPRRRGSGATMSPASAVIPNPATSARTVAPRAPGVLLGLEDQHPGPVADHHALAPQAERAARVGRQHPQPLPGLDAAKAQHRLGPAGQHHIRHARPGSAATPAPSRGWHWRRPRTPQAPAPSARAGSTDARPARCASAAAPPAARPGFRPRQRPRDSCPPRSEMPPAAVPRITPPARPMPAGKPAIATASAPATSAYCVTRS